MLSMLQTLLATSPDVRLAADYKTQTIVAFASPAQQETIAKSIQEIDTSATGRVLAVYRGIDASPANDDLAVGLARTAAFFSNDQAPLSSRTVRFVSGVHFPP